MIHEDTLLTWGATFKKLAAGEAVFREGTEARFYHQLISGSVRWTHFTEEGKEFIQHMVESGDCFGELPLFDDLPYAASAIANKESIIIRLNKTSFHQLLRDCPEISFAFHRLLAERLRFKMLFLQELAGSDPEHTILTLFNYFKRTKTNICQLCNKVNLTRQQIADMTGLRVETVIRTIRSLQEKGTLTIERGKVYCK